MIYTVVQLAIVVDLILTVLVATTCREAYHLTLVLERSLWIEESLNYEFTGHALKLFLVEVGYGRVEGCQDDRFLGLVSQRLIDRVEVELREAVPGLLVDVYLL